MVNEKPIRKEFSNKLKEHIYLKCVGKCTDCGNSKTDYPPGWHRTSVDGLKKTFLLGGLEIHHIVSVSLGGTNKTENLILLCKECHKIRHGKKKGIYGTAKKTEG